MCSSDLVVPDDAKRAERVKYTVDKYRGCAVRVNRQGEFVQRPCGVDPSAQKIGKDFREEVAWKNLVESFSTIVDAAEKNDITITFEAASECSFTIFTHFRNF